MGEIDDGLPSYMFQTTAAKSNMKTLIWIQQYPWLRRAFNGTATRSVWKIRESTLKSLRLIGSFSFKKRFVVVKQESPLDQADNIQVDAVLKYIASGKDSGKLSLGGTVFTNGQHQCILYGG